MCKNGTGAFSRLATVAALSTVLLFSVAVRAQGTDEQASDAPADEEVVKLSLFEVSVDRDDGYFSKNTLLGTRTNERLINIPQNITIVNSQFLQDTGFDNGIDALRYAISGGDKRDSASTDIYIRGVRLGNASFLKNGVKFRGSAANPPIYDIDRIEVIKGPAALLFGLDASAGGVINYVTLPASERTDYRVKATFGSFNLKRGQVGVSGPVGNTGLSYRVTAVASDGDGPRRFDKFEDRFFSVALTYQLSEHARAEFYYNYYFVDPIRQPGRTLNNNTLPVGVPDDFSVMEEWAEAPRYMHYLNATLTVQLMPTLEGRFYVNASNHDHDRHQVFGGTANSTTGNVSRTYQNFFGTERAYNGQADFVKTFDTGSVSHKVTFGFAAKFQRLIQYVDQLPMPARNIYNPVYGDPMPILPGRGQVSGATATNQRAYETNIYIQEQATAFDGKLIVIGGFGRVAENNRLKNIYTNAVTRDRSSSGELVRYGAVFKPMDWISVFYGKSESLSFFNTTFPSGPRAGDFLDPSYTESDDFGVKVETADGMWFGGVTAFDMVRTNVSRQIINPDGTQGVVQEGSETNKGWEADIGFRFSTPVGPLQSIFTYYDGDSKNDASNRPNGVTNKTWSLFIAQSIDSGPLNGLKFGAGAYWKDEFNFGAFLVPDHDEFTAFVSYAWKGWTASLNVDNLSDDRFIEAGTGTADLSISPGRTYKFTVGVRF